MTKLILSFFFLAAAISASQAASADTDGHELFERRCAACHKLPDPDQPPPRGWVEQLKLMAPLAQLKKDQSQAVLDYLTSHSEKESKVAVLEEDRAVFEEKCSRCHTLDRVLLSPLRGESLKHVVSRMQNRSGTNWLTDDDVKKIIEYLDSDSRQTIQPKPLSSNTSSAEIFAARCSACHSLERIVDKLEDDTSTADFWSHTVGRMQGKAPQWLSDKEAGKILEYLRSVHVEPQ